MQRDNKLYWKNIIKIDEKFFAAHADFISQWKLQKLIF